MNETLEIIRALSREVDLVVEEKNKAREEEICLRDEVIGLHKMCHAKDKLIAEMKALVTCLYDNARVYDKDGHDGHATATRLIINDLESVLKRYEDSRTEARS
jgi:hypothetical protein